MKIFRLALVPTLSAYSVVLAAVVLLSPIADAQAPVPVAVIVKTSQFEDQAQKDRVDSAKDLKGQLSTKKKTLRLVETATDAAVVIEVLGRGEQAQDTKTVERGILSGRVEQRSDTAKVLRVKLSVGDYSTDIEGRDEEREFKSYTTWGVAAGDAAIQIDKWIKANRAKLH
jgi:hypothetical protein